MSLVLLNQELMCTQKLLQVSSSYFVWVFFFLGSQKRIIPPDLGPDVIHLPDKAVVGLLAPSFSCLLVVLCFVGLFWVDSIFLLVCMVLGWHPQ